MPFWGIKKIKSSQSTYEHTICQIKLFIDYQIDTCREVVKFPIHSKALSCNEISKKAHFTWLLSQTDFIELMDALGKTGTFGKKDGIAPTTKELIEYFSGILNLSVDSWESKLSKAHHRKKRVSKFLSNLHQILYCPKL